MSCARRYRITMGPACNLPRLRFRAGIRIRVISEIIGKINEHLRKNFPRAGEKGRESADAECRSGAGTRGLFAIIIYPTRVSFVHRRYPIIISLLLVVHCSTVSGHSIRTRARIAALRAATSVIVAQMRYRRFRFAICRASPLRLLLGSENAAVPRARVPRTCVYCVCIPSMH